jgi:hypothetical protein
MQYVLVVLEKPRDEKGEKYTNWKSFAPRVSGKSAPPGSVERIDEQVYQIRLDDGLLVLAQLLVDAENSKIPFRALFLDDDPRWVRSQATADSGEAK